MKKLPTNREELLCDPVGIQTQDLQNFFWPHSANKKLLTMAMARSYKRDPVGIQTQDLQNRNLYLLNLYPIDFHHVNELSFCPSVNYK